MKHFENAFLILFLVFFASAHAFAVDLTVGSGNGDPTVQIPITVSAPTGIAGASFTITYDTDWLTVGVDSTFFDTFAVQFAGTQAPTSVEVDGITYAQPLITNDVTGTGTRVAAARATPADASNANLFILNVSCNQGATGPFTIGISPTNINNTDAGYPAEGEDIPYLVGADPDEQDLTLAYPVIAVGSIFTGTISCDPPPVPEIGYDRSDDGYQVKFSVTGDLTGVTGVSVTGPAGSGITAFALTYNSGTQTWEGVYPSGSHIGTLPTGSYTFTFTGGGIDPVDHDYQPGTPMGIPVIDTPIDETYPIVNWFAVSGSDAYYVNIYDNSSTLIYDGSSSTTGGLSLNISSIMSGEPDGDYYAQVVATDADGNQTFSCLESFEKILLSYQIITGSPNPAYSSTGGAFNVDVNYDTSTGDNTLSGLGLRIHFDSSKLTWNSFSDVFSSGKVAEDTTGQYDSADYDNDPNTDRYVSVAWASVGANWPNSSLPLKLLRTNFTLSNSFVQEDTTYIRFSASSTASGYTLSDEPVSVTLGPTCTLDVDDNGVYDALTDGLLIIRYLFGFRGQTLIQDAIGDNPGRSTATEIEAYLQTCIDNDALDIDDNGADDALTDGLLIIRYLFGFRGQTLIQDAIGDNPGRSTAAEIEAYLASLCP